MEWQQQTPAQPTCAQTKSGNVLLTVTLPTVAPGNTPLEDLCPSQLGFHISYLQGWMKKGVMESRLKNLLLTLHSSPATVPLHTHTHTQLTPLTGKQQVSFDFPSLLLIPVFRSRSFPCTSISHPQIWIVLPHLRRVVGDETVSSQCTARVREITPRSVKPRAN